MDVEMNDEDQSSVVRLKCLGSDEVISCQQTLLSQQSKFFKKLFSSPLEIGKAEFLLNDVSFPALTRIIQFLCTSTIELDGSSVLEILSLSLYLDVPSLQTICEDFLIANASVLDYVMIHSFATSNHAARLAGTIWKRMLDSGDEIISEKLFLEFSPIQMAGFVGSKDLNIEKEEACWYALRDWYNVDQKNRICDFLKMLESIRFPLIQDRVLKAIEHEADGNKTLQAVLQPYINTAYSLQKDTSRSFEIQHPRYSLRDPALADGIVVVSSYLVQNSIPVPWPRRTSENPSLLGILNPTDLRVRWFHSIPSDISWPTFCSSPAGELFVHDRGSCESSRVLKYQTGTDVWEVVFETKLGSIYDICVEGDIVYVFNGVFSDRIGVVMCTVWHANGVWNSRDDRIPFDFEGPVAVHGGCIYAFNNKPKHSPYDYKGILYTYCFDPRSKKWSRKQTPCLDQQKWAPHAHIASHTDGLIYFIGAQCDVIHSYNPTKDTWSIVASNKTVLFNLSKGKLVVMLESDARWRRRRDLAVRIPLEEDSCEHGEVIIRCEICDKATVAIYDTAKDIWEPSTEISFRVSAALRENHNEVKTVTLVAPWKSLDESEELHMRVAELNRRCPCRRSVWQRIYDFFRS